MAPTRRDFLKNSAGLLAVCCSVAALGSLSACTNARYVAYTQKDKQLLVLKTDLLDEKYVLIDHKELQAPIYLKKYSETEFKAFLMLCTHKGCDVKPAGSILVCPCHGSEFSSQGKVLKGPASRDLHEFQVTLQEDHIVIEIA